MKDPWPVFDVMKECNLVKNEIPVTDNLKPGITMENKAGADSVGVGWSHHIPEIIEDMKKTCTYYASSIQEFEGVLLPQM